MKQHLLNSRRLVSLAILAGSGLATTLAPTALGSTQQSAVASTVGAFQRSVPVAKISVIAPYQESFVLEATLPVPPGTVLPSMTAAPLAIARNGVAVTTQLEIVSRYPNPADGADVVELIARVARPAGVSPGTEIEFDVVLAQSPPQAISLTQNVRALLSTPGALKLTANDLHGNGYTADLTAKVRAGDPSVTTPRDGVFLRETRSHEVMMPNPGSGTGTTSPYEHLLGVHTFVRTYSGQDFVALDLNVHNGIFGLSNSEMDDAIADAYFDSLKLHMPAGWDVDWAITNAMLGAKETVNGEVIRPLIRPLRLNQFHNVPQQSQFHRRLIIARGPEAMARGRSVLRRETRGFCVPSDTPPNAVTDPSAEIWSWWNPSTARFLPSNTRLPVLTHLQRVEVTNELRALHNTVETQVASGDEGIYPMTFGQLGWAHPWGVQYGGMTGGDEIEMVPGIREAWSRNPVGLRFLEQQSKAYVDRHPVAIFQLDGHPPRVEEHVLLRGTPQEHVDGYFYLKPDPGNRYFNFNHCDWRFTELAYMTARTPYYEKDLKEFSPIDLQHHTRFLNSHLSLVWLANDSLSKLQLELANSVFHFSFHKYNNSFYDSIQGTGLLRRKLDTAAEPNKGNAFGRGEAWGLIGSLGYYSIAGDAERDTMRDWFEDIGRTAHAGLSACTGNPTAYRIAKAFKGVYHVRQSFEVSFILHAAQAMRSTVFQTVDQPMSDLLDDYIITGAYSTIHPPFWNPVAQAQYQRIAVRPRFVDEPEFCFNIPENGYDEDPFFDHTTAMPAWSYAYEATGDGIFLQRATQTVGGSGNLIVELEKMGTTLIYEVGPLLTLLQTL